MKWSLVFTLFLLILLTVCPSSGQPVNGSRNETNGTALHAVFSSENEPAVVPSLSYIWSVTGIESGQVIMVLNQNGSDIFGQAKYEPDSGPAWNAVVTGFVDEDCVNLVLTALKGTVQFSSRLKGTYDSAEQSIKGDLLQVSRGNVSMRGKFEAVWINPDISSYTAAQVAQFGAKLPVAGKAQENATVQDATVPEAKEGMLLASSSKSRYHDVRVDADRILTGVGDISQIPIGMGGSGLP